MLEVRSGVSVEHAHIRDTALALFDLLTTFSFGVSRRHAANDGDDEAGDAGGGGGVVSGTARTARFTSKLSELALSVREEELVFAARYLTELAETRGEGPELPGTAAQVAFGVEGVVYKHLTFVFSATTTPTGQAFALRPAVLGALVALMWAGSPRVQRTAVRVLEVALTAVPTAELAGTLAAAGLGSADRVVTQLLARVARSLCVEAPTAATVMPPRPAHVAGHMSKPPAAPGMGHLVIAASADTMGLLRRMATEAAWKAAVTNAVVAALRAVHRTVTAGAMTEAEGTRRAMSLGCAALCVLGGNIEVLRPGCKVALANHAGATATADALNQALLQHASEGVVVEMSPWSRVASVLFGGGSTGAVDVQELPVEQLVPVASVPARPDAVALDADAVRILFGLLELEPVMDKSAKAGASGRGAGAGGAGASGDTGGSKHVQTPALEVWKAELKARALEAVLHLMQHKPTATTVLSSDLLAKLLNEALVPVALPQFVSLNALQRRAALVRCRLLERATGLRYGGGVGSEGGGGEMTARERDRVALAKSLAMMAGCSEKLCVKALLLHNDDPDRAANWLMSSGAEVFVRGGGLEDDSADATPRGAAARELGLMMGMPPKVCYHALELSGDDTNRATLWLIDHGAFYADKVDESSGGLDEAGDSSDTKAAADSAVLEGIEDGESLVGGGRRASLHRRLSRRRMGGDGVDGGDGEGDEASKQEELANAKRAQLEAGANGPPEALLQLVNVGAGMAPGAGLQGGIILCYTNTTGVVERLCHVGQQGAMIPASAVGNTISLRLLNWETGKLYDGVVSLDQVRLVTSLFAHRVTGPAMIRHLALAAEMALATHAARRAVLSLLLTWPEAIPLTLRALGGAAQLVSLSKFVAASEHVFDTAADAENPGFSPLTDVLRAKLRWFLANAGATGGGARGAGAGGHAVAPGGGPRAGAGAASGWACATCTFQNPGAAGRCQMCDSERPAASSFSAEARARLDESLTAVLVRDCVWNVVESTRPGNATEVDEHESLHPFFRPCSYKGEFKFLGAKALMVKFDPRCDVAEAVLTFTYVDANGKQSRSFSGGADEFKPFVVQTDRLAYHFRTTSSSGSPHWGYRVRVSPMRGLQWLNEPQILSDASLEWACWLLDFLLNDGAVAIKRGVLHNASVFNALVRYLRTPGCPYKERVIMLLTQLLRSPHLFDRATMPDLGALTGLQGVVFQEVGRRRTGGTGLFLPQRLQQLVELSVVNNSAQRAMARNDPPRTKFNPEAAFTQGGGNMFSNMLGRTRRTLRIPVAKGLPPPESALSLHDTLAIVFDVAECLVLGARLPDSLTCLVYCHANGLPEGADASRLDVKKLAEAVLLYCEWDQADDEELVEWAQTVASRSSCGLSDLDCSKLVMTARDEVSYPVIARKSAASRKVRFAVLRLFNRRLAACIELLDTSNTAHAWSIGHQLRALGHVIFGDTKTRLVDAAVDTTWHPGSCPYALTLDNQAAFASMDARKVDPADSKCLFVQAFSQLNDKQSAFLRCKLDHRGRLFQVKFRGEDGVDWGGLFRDALTRMVEDCFSDHFNLLLPTPNARANAGVNTDKYVPNPCHTSPRCVKMFEFLGKLLGVSMRLKLYLPFELPSLIWKPLVGQPLSAVDIRDIDEATYDLIEQARTCQARGITSQAAFESQFGQRCFTVPGSDGKEVDLVPGASEAKVTFDNKDTWAQLAMDYRLHEFDRQIAAIRRGMAAVVPERALKLCTWQALEMLVCGDPHIDVDVLMAHTTYHGAGFNAGNSTVKRFWRVFRSMTDKERSKFVMFAWGRSRLPKADNWDRPFKLTSKNGGDDILPLAHTCFFQIELPAYSSDEIMKQRLIAASTYGIGAFLMA